MADLGSTTFSQTDASNASGTMPSWSGAAAPSTIDDAGRALQGAVTREWNWRNYTLSAGGGGLAMTLTYSVAPAAYYNGQVFSFLSKAVTGACTLNVNGLGAKAIKKRVGGAYVDLASGDINLNDFVEVAYNTANGWFVWTNQPGAKVGEANSWTGAQSFFGLVGLGNTLSNAILNINNNVTGSTGAFAINAAPVVQNDVTGSAHVFRSAPLCASTTATSNLYHFFATQGDWSTGSMTNQYGFVNVSTTIDATNNIGFWAQNAQPAVTGKTSIGFQSTLNVPTTSGATTWGLYLSGNAWNLTNGPLIQTDVAWINAPAPTAKTTSVTLTGAELKAQIISVTGAGGINLTLPTGTNIDAAFTSIPSTTNIGFDFSVINTSTGSATMVVNTGVTSLAGSLVVATLTSATFRLRRTAANTYVLYRLT